MKQLTRAFSLRYRSIRWRLTLWYAGLLALVLTVFAAGSLLVMARVLATRSDQFLEEAHGAYVGELQVEWDELGSVVAASRAAAQDTRFRDTWIFVFDSTGALLARGDASGREGSWRHGSLSASALTAIARRLGIERARGAVFSTIDDEEGSYRALVQPVTVARHHLSVVAIQPRHPIMETLEQVAIGYLIAIPVVLLAAVGGGYVLARRSLAPMADMTLRTRAIGAENLHARLAAPNAHDEVGELAAVVNDLLARLEAAVGQQRRFVADASHELRTPVSTVCAEADIALSMEYRSESDYRESLTVVRDAGRRLSRIVDDLFILTRIDAGHLPIERAPLYLDELMRDVARSLRAQAQGRMVRISFAPAGEAPLVGDAGLLGRLFLNVLDNAIKHSPAHGVIGVTLTCSAQSYRIAITDQGSGVPDSLKERIFERFFRGDPSRSRTAESATAGAGLGLAIARWIAEAHGGTLRLDARSDDERGGAVFSVELPISSRNPSA